MHGPGAPSPLGRCQRRYLSRGQQLFQRGAATRRLLAITGDEQLMNAAAAEGGAATAARQAVVYS